MIAITPLAQEKLSAFLAENQTKPQVRVFWPSNGCGGDSQLALTVDEPTADDFSVQAGGLTLSIDRKLQEITGSVTIDFQDLGHDSGFIVDPEKILPVSDSDSCGGGCCDCC
jgi:Fe-S cluster assembly iron-binding protein IscA